MKRLAIGSWIVGFKKIIIPKYANFSNSEYFNHMIILSKNRLLDRPGAIRFVLLTILLLGYNASSYCQELNPVTTDRLIEEALTSVGDGNIYNGPRYLVTIMQSLIKMGKIKKANEVTDKAIAAALINKAGDPYNCAYEFVDIFDALIQQRKTEQAQKIADTLLVLPITHNYSSFNS